jgi:hypothetical protein
VRAATPAHQYQLSISASEGYTLDGRQVPAERLVEARQGLRKRDPQVVLNIKIAYPLKEFPGLDAAYKAAEAAGVLSINTSVDNEWAAHSRNTWPGGPAQHLAKYSF